MMESPWLLVGGGAFLAGAMNALAGGGTFFSFPALLAAGVPPVMANATNTVGLCPASLASAWAYRREAWRHGSWALLLALLSLVGGLAGGLLLLATGDATFSRLIPWLLLVATGLFAFSRPLAALVARCQHRFLGATPGKRRPGSPGGALLQLAVAIYGGFFGAGMGILTLAALSIQGFEDMQDLNALKNLTSGLNYAVSALTFIIAGAVSWPHALLMLATGLAGGYGGSRLARRIPGPRLKVLVVGLGTLLTLIYFRKTYFV